MAHSPTHLVRQLINKLVEIRRTSPGTKTVLHASFDDTFMGKKHNLRKNKLHGTNRGSYLFRSKFTNTENVKIPNPIWKNLSIFKAFPSRAYRFISILKQPQSHDNNQMKLVGFSYQ